MVARRTVTLLALLALVAFASAWQHQDDNDDVDEDATFERGVEAPAKNNQERRKESIAQRIMKQLKRFESKMEDFEARFNQSLSDLKSATTVATPQPYYGRYKGYQWTPWVPPTTTLSPKEKCLANQDVLCYDDQCVKADKLCDGVKDCSDDSDEFFCKPNAPETLQPTNKCPHGFVGSAKVGKCYWFAIEKPLNWISAVVDCVKRSGKLVSIRSRLEQESIAHHLKAEESLVNATFWIGATNILRNQTNYNYWPTFSNADVNKMWTWVPSRIGQAVESMADAGFAFWKSQQPDGGANEVCLEMRGDFRWQWNDQQCHKENFYICEVPIHQ